MTPAARAWVRSSLGRYWPQVDKAIIALPLPEAVPPETEPLPPRLSWITLPEWATEFGEDGRLPVPTWTLTTGAGDQWQRCDWWAAAFWFLNGSAERAFEATHGPTHSYSLRLKGWDPRLWQRAWVNRIALFLRRWASRQAGADEATLLGPLPGPELLLTHDVDAVSKTLPIRLKQSAFHGFNALRALTHGKVGDALARSGQALRFLFSQEDYWCFPTVRALEQSAGVRSCFNLYAGGAPRNPKEWLLDPAYDVESSRLADELKDMVGGGWQVGLHQAFGSWRDPTIMVTEKARLEAVVGAPVRSCRQHWLRFSWEETWRAQAAAGLTLDTTLGFNDRPGFRIGTALRFQPWDQDAERTVGLSTLPLLLMDSHLYDYGFHDQEQRRHAIAHWLGELDFVGGQASIVWHQRGFSDDYRWADGYAQLLEFIGSRKLISMAPE